MRLEGMLPSRTALSGLVLLAYLVRADDLSNAYCSSENTGSGFKAVYSIYQSMGSCQQTCVDKYAFAVLQGKYCWCSNYIPADTVSVGNCNEDCPGYPSDQCGNTAKDLFGYVSLNLSPKGTQGATSSTQSTATSIETVTATTSVVSQFVTATITQEQFQSPSVVVSYITPQSSSQPASSSPTTSTKPQTTTRVTTIAGAPVTQTVTTTPYLASPNANDSGATQSSALSGGAIAGIVIGGLVGLAVLALAGFLLWRRRRYSDAGGEGEGGVKRHTSVLSKTGLLYPFRPTSMAENHYDDHGQPTRSNSVRHSMMYGGSSNLGGDGVSPASPLAVSTQGSSSSRGRSRPRLYDQRLNPSALYPSHSNSSRVSIQDQQDYSRPLGVTNPDVRRSTDSR